MVTARPFDDMIDPDPVAGSVDPDELEALQPPYDPRGLTTYATNPNKYPDAPTKDYVNEDATLYNKVLAYGARIWEPVAVPTIKTDSATGKSYKLYPLGTLQHAKVITWFEPRPTLLDGVASPIIKNSSLGFQLVPQLADVTDQASGQPTTIITAVGWYPTDTAHDNPAASTFNPLVMFIPPSGPTAFTATDKATLASRLLNLKGKGVRILYNRTVIKQ